MIINLDWENFKGFVDERKLSIQHITTNERYNLFAIDGQMAVSCQILIETPAGSEQEDFETVYKNKGNKSPYSSVTTQAEKNDKTLRTFSASATTDSNGIAEFAIQVPTKGRYVAYGDCEFEERQFLDSVSVLEVSDLDRLVAWQIALSIDPDATEPVSDAVVQANGYPIYPILDHYDERAFPETPTDNSKSTIISGMGMTFQYGITEAEPVGGYAFLPEGVYLVIRAKKETAVSGKRCKISIDWAEPMS